MSELEKPKIDFKYNLKVYLGLLKKYWVLLTIVLLLVLFNEGINTATKFIFKSLIDNGTTYEAGTLLQSAFVHILIILGVIFFALLIAKIIMKWFSVHILNILESNIIRDVKIKYFNHIIDLSHGFHTSHKTGSLISRVNRGGSAVERMTDLVVFNVAPLIFQLILITVSMSFFSGTTVIVVISTVIVFLVYSFIMQQVQRPSSMAYNYAEDVEKGTIADIFINVDSIKYFGKENPIKDKFYKVTGKTKSALMKNWGYFRWMDAGQSLILGIGTFLLIYFPIQEFINNQITLGTLVFIYTLYLDLMGPMFGFVGAMRNYYRSMVDFNDLFQYGKIENEIKDKADAKDLVIKNGEVELNNISFKYNTRKVISDLSLKIKPGEKIALVGHSGCGKTTLVKLLYRFYDTTSGDILIDGYNTKDVKQESLRSELSIVPQEAILFDDSIYNNIAFSSPHAKRTDVLRAIRFAQLDKFVSHLPDKENTIVGERGVKLSGGEKQRVSIARALLANKRILILDEATSSLDSQTEHEIQNDLVNLMKGRTSIIIAHRLSTIMQADRIVVMEKGKIVQIGNHRELITKQGQYKKLWNLQKGGYIKE